MAIIKTCENCVYGKNKKSFFATCEEDDVSYCYHFIPKEQLIRSDEIEKIINTITESFSKIDKKDLQDMVNYYEDNYDENEIFELIAGVKECLEKEITDKEE